MLLDVLVEAALVAEAHIDAARGQYMQAGLDVAVDILDAAVPLQWRAAQGVVQP